MVHTRAVLPQGHGELLTRPPYQDWATLIELNKADARTFAFSVATVPALELRTLARREVVEAAYAFSERIGVPVRDLGLEPDTIVLTGHQPELYHPGVWVKDFLLERLSVETGALAIDLVVDSDGFDELGLTAPCMSPQVRRCTQVLAMGGPDVCYACTPVPSESELEGFRAGGARMLATLPAPAVARHFETFCDCLDAVAPRADNVAELVTFARRCYEAQAQTTYLELPVTTMARSEAFRTFTAEIMLNAEEFAGAFNAELAEFRMLSGTRSAAQPFPDLKCEGAGRVEIPFWYIDDKTRRPVWVLREERSLAVFADDVEVLRTDATPHALIAALRGHLFAPRAVTLTLFARTFVGDMFIHGVGGGRYDVIADGVCRRYFGAEPMRFAVASMTMYLPLGAHVVSDEEIAELRQRLNRLEHNPDSMLEEVDCDDAAEREKARSLAAEKQRLVVEIAAPDADKKSLGKRIREVNEELAELLAPLGESLRAELLGLEGQRAAGEILTDRTYAFCLWSPLEVQDKVR